MRHLAKFILGLGLVSLAGAVAVEAMHRHSETAQVDRSLAPPLMRVPLLGDDGKTTTLAERRGAWMVVLLGFTNCSDVCPTSLSYMHRELSAVNAAQPIVQGIFVSLDPSRDTPEILGPYVRKFDPHLRAYTGTEANLRVLAKELGAYAEDSGAGRLMMHSPSLFVLDPAGRLVKTISPPFGPGELAKELERQLAASAH